MNNALLNDNEEIEIDKKVKLRSRESELTSIIESISTIADCKEWQVLKKQIFNDLVKSLEKRLVQEAEKDSLNDGAIYRLNGQLNFARKYADFDKLADAYRLELKNIREIK